VNVPNPHASDTGGLYALYERGDLAIVDAAGSPDVTGSHFDTELYVDLGGKQNNSGWVARYLDAIGEPTDALSVAPQWGIPPSLLSLTGRSALAVPNASEFGPQWRTNTRTSDRHRKAITDQQRILLDAMYQRGNAFVESTGRAALAMYDALANVFNSTYTPAALSHRRQLRGRWRAVRSLPSDHRPAGQGQSGQPVARGDDRRGRRVRHARQPGHGGLERQQPLPALDHQPGQ
jgi:hypothetical protein